MHILKQRSVLWFLLIINSLGTIYGYIWYQYQLSDTPWYFIPFVPDSPTASLFFVFVLIGFLLRRHFPLFEALAAITLFKYGIWAVGMNIGGIVVTQSATVETWMLIFSHFGMAVQALLYAPYYTFKLKHFLIALIWTFHNDIIDYVFFMFPRYPPLDDHMAIIGYVTFWLTAFTCYLIYRLTLKSDRFTLNIHN